MPNPFPGMNPYLEEPFDWQSFHNVLVVNMLEALNAVLPANYVAVTQVRCLIQQTGREILPDVTTLQRRPALSPPGTGSTGGAGGTAVLSPPASATSDADDVDLPLVLALDTWEERQAFVDVMHVTSGKFKNAQAVTSIEVLSPTNKNTHNQGYEAYRRKQEQVLSSETNLLEIDLLRAGAYSLAVPRSALPSDRAWDYITCLHRATRRAEYMVWLASVRDRLPRVEVPLADSDPSIALNLQAIVNRTYDVGAYDRQIDYMQSANPPLEGDDALWADALLRERGLRS